MNKKAYIQLPIPVQSTPGMRPPPTWKAMIKGLCPRCRRGKVFQKALYSLGFSKMNIKCPHCDMKYEIEPGFFWGAMYLNYGISVFIAALSGVTFSAIKSDPSPWSLLAFISTIVIFFAPLVFRSSRMIMLYFLSFIPFQQEAYKNNLHKHN